MSMRKTRWNWAHSRRYSARRLYAPQSLEALRRAVGVEKRVTVLGTRHSFSAVANTPDVQISVRQLRESSLGPTAATATFGAGVTYDHANEFLHANGYALDNLASLAHISVAGANATGTHGSGDSNPILASQVAELQLMTADGELVTVSRSDADTFHAVAVSLGGFGVVTATTLAIQPAFEIRQRVFLGLTAETLNANVDAILAAGYSVSIFTKWGPNANTRIWVKEPTGNADRASRLMSDLGAHEADHQLHPVEGVSGARCTTQMGIAGPSHERLPHFRSDFRPSVGREIQSECFIPRESIGDAVTALREIASLVDPHLFVSEIRTVAADEFWMSPCYQRTSASIHFTWKPDLISVSKVIPIVEDHLARFTPRPHWGKLFTIPLADLRGRYPRFDEWIAQRQALDPTSKFVNPFLDELLG